MQKLAVLLLLPLLALVACSDDDGGDEAVDASGSASAPADTDTGDTDSADTDTADTDTGATDSSDTSDADAGSSGGGGDEEAFCTLLTEESDAELDPTTPEGQAMMAEILETAPEELRPDIESLFSLFEELEGLDEDDPEAFGEIFAAFFDPEVMAALQSLEDWGVEHCGLEPGTLTGTGDDLDEDLGDDSGSGSGSFDFDSGDGGDPVDPDTIELDPEQVAESWTDLDHLDAWLEWNYEGTAWVEALFTKSSSPGFLYVGGELTADDALAVCEALEDYAAELDMTLDLEVSDGDSTVLADNSSGACASV